MSHFEQNQAPVSYPPPAPAAYSSGPYVAAPPPAGYPMKDGPGYPQNYPPISAKTKSKGDGFWKGCCAALCCCCMLDACF